MFTFNIPENHQNVGSDVDLSERLIKGWYRMLLWSHPDIITTFIRMVMELWKFRVEVLIFSLIEINDVKYHGKVKIILAFFFLRKAFCLSLYSRLKNIFLQLQNVFLKSTTIYYKKKSFCSSKTFYVTNGSWEHP
jgi:hypothetical protein